MELLEVDDTVRHIIYEDSMAHLNHYLLETGFHSFRMAAIAKVTSGITTVEEVLRVLPHSALHRTSKPQEVSAANGKPNGIPVRNGN